MFEGAVCIGICTPSPVEGKRIFLNPPGDTIINGGDQLIFIAEDNDTYWPADTLFLTSPGACPDVQEPPKQPVKTLCIGWRRDMHEMIIEVDKWVPPGSELAILAPGSEDDGFCPAGPTLEEREAELLNADCDVNAMTNIKVSQYVDSPILRSALKACNIGQYHAVLVLTAEAEGKEGITSDSRSMVTMLLARDCQRQLDTAGIIGRNPVLICEILDPRTADLVSIAAANDHMVSNLMVSECLGQMSQEINISPLIDDMFCPEGNEMHIKPVNLYAAPGESLSFWEIMARGRMRCEVTIGFYQNGELVLNPEDKSAKINWQADDRIVVISED